jgi:cytochrome c oxidase subunit I+III
VEIGGGIRLPTYVSGPQSHSWWAMIVLLLVAAALYLSYVFAYLYLWTVSEKGWQPVQLLPDLSWPAISAGLLLVSGAALAVANRLIGSAKLAMPAIAASTIGGVVALIASLGLDIWGQWQSDLRPNATAYGAIVYTANVLQFEIVTPVTLMAGFMLARLFAGRLDATRRVVFDNLALFWAYAIGQGLLGLMLTHGFPRLVG